MQQVFIGVSVFTFLGKRQNRLRLGFYWVWGKMVPKHSRFHGKKPTSGFEVPTGSGKVPYAIARIELYIPPKFHPNRFTRIGEDKIFNV